MLTAWLMIKAWTAGLVEFIQTPLGRYVTVGALVLLVGFFYGHVRYDAGVKHQRAVQAAELVKARAHVAKVEKASAAISADVGAKLETRQAEIRTITQTLIKEVPRYVTVESDRACVVGVGALQLHNHAFAGLPGLPAGSGGSVEADSGVALSALVADDVEFAGTAYSWKAEALAWRTWYGRQADLWDKEVSAKR